MKGTWTRGLEEDQHERIRNAFTSSADMRARLTTICEEKVKAAMTTRKTQYDSPSWVYEQADAVGYQRALEEILSLLGN